jgi:hypothetical protein
MIHERAVKNYASKEARTTRSLGNLRAKVCRPSGLEICFFSSIRMLGACRRKRAHKVKKDDALLGNTMFLEYFNGFHCGSSGSYSSFLLVVYRKMKASSIPSIGSRSKTYLLAMSAGNLE